MRNKYPGKCYVCGQPCGPGDGYFERYNRGWRVRHELCDPKKKVMSNADT